MQRILMKRIAVILAIVYMFAACFACRTARVIVPDYSAYISNLFRYYVSDGSDLTDGDVADIEEPKDDVKSERPLAEVYDGLINICEYKFDKAMPFFGKSAYAEYDGKGYLLNRDGSCNEVDKSPSNTVSDIVLESIIFDKLLVKRDDKYGVLDLSGKTILDAEYDRVEILGNTIAAAQSKTISVFRDGEKKFETYGDNFNIASEEFIQIDNRFLTTDSGETAKISEYSIRGIPNNDITLVANSNNNFGYCSYSDGKTIIEPQYFLASAFSEGIACVANYKLDLENVVFNDYYKLIDKDNNVIFNFDVFKNEFLPNQMTVFPKTDNHCVVRFSSASEKYGAVEFSGDTVSFIDLEYEPEGNRFYGDYYIIKESGALFSTKSNSIVSTEYLKVEPICKSLFLASLPSGGFSVLDSKLNVVVDCCESVETYEDTLLICKDDAYAYYKTA